MRRYSVTVHRVERAFLLLGLFLLSVFALSHLHRLILVHAEMARFNALRQAIVVHPPSPARGIVANPKQTFILDTALWSLTRMKAYEATLSKAIEPIAVLRIPRLNLEVPVLEDTDEFTLNRGVGRIKNTSLPGQSGNLGIAGHRDGFFRSLRDIRIGDTIDLDTVLGTKVYVVNRVRITDPSDLSVLRPHEKPSLTLVTCYPFYFVGPAPHRYIVEASLRE